MQAPLQSRRPLHSKALQPVTPCIQGRTRTVVTKRPGDGMCTPAVARPSAPVQKDMTAQLLERAFTLALQARLKQHAGIDVDVRSTAWGLMEGRFGGLTVRGRRWRTPLELTAESLSVDVGELELDYHKLMWQQTVALKNVPQGSVSFTLTSADLANFMVHPIMTAAASRAVKGHAFRFDRSTASVRIDPATGRGVVSYQGVWAGDGQRYAVAMSTPPPPPPAAAGARGAAATSLASRAAGNNTLEQLSVSARRMPMTPVGSAPVPRSTTGSFASVGSMDQTAAQVPSATAWAGAAAAAPAAGLSAASVGSEDGGGGECEPGDPGAEAVAEGLRRFFSGLVLNLQGVELRQPTLLVQLPGGAAAAAAAARSPALGHGGGAPAAAAAGGPVGGGCGSGPGGVPALLTISMKVAIVQLPPLNMKF